MQGNAPGINKCPHLGNRVRRGAEVIAPVDQRHRFGDIDQIDRPVEGRITAAGNNQLLASQPVALTHRILYRAAGLKRIQIGKGWPLWNE